MEEQEIVVACQNGELEKFALLYDNYVKKIYSFFYFRTSHKETAEDLTSQTFAKALEKINSFNSSKASFQTWLYTIARNNLTDEYRTKKPTEDISEALHIPGKANTEHDTDTSLQLEKVKKLLNQLSPEQKEIITLRLWQDLPFKDIAQITGKTESACKMQFGRILKNWQEILITLFILFLSLKS